MTEWPDHNSLGVTKEVHSHTTRACILQDPAIPRRPSYLDWPRKEQYQDNGDGTHTITFQGAENYKVILTYQLMQ